VERERRKYQNIVYRDTALYCVEGQEKKSKYFVMIYGFILWEGTEESIKILCIEIWHYTVEKNRRSYQIIEY
jgi:hypothetical protein